MLNPAGNAPTVAGLRLKFLRADKEAETAPHQVTRLLMGMRMTRQYAALAQAELRHEGLVAVNQGLSFNSSQRRMVAVIASFLEHAHDAF